MSDRTSLRPPRTSSRGARQPGVGWMVALSVVCLAAQVLLTDYGATNAGAAAFWFGVGSLLLWLVAVRRSRLARAAVVVTSLLGAVVYGAAAFSADLRTGLIALAFVGQALPLMTRPVREHVGRTG